MTTGSVTGPKSGQQGKQEIEGEENPDRLTDPIPVERPPRDEASISNAMIIKELKNWRKIILEYMDGKRNHSSFTPEFIPVAMANSINELLEQSVGDFNAIKKLFSAAIMVYEE